jgi:site-specific DNA-methyltransferase (adenine-specific)
MGGKATITQIDAGRWPANLILDEDAAAALDEQSGISTRNDVLSNCAAGGFSGNIYGDSAMTKSSRVSDLGGGASRFFYVAKASKADRNAGLDGVEATPAHLVQGRTEGSPGSVNPRAGITAAHANTHPTVKPLALMRYLVRLVTPPGGVVLEPFCGSGTTLLACEREGFACRAFEMDPHHCDIILARWEGLTGERALRLGDEDVPREETVGEA